MITPCPVQTEILSFVLYGFNCELDSNTYNSNWNILKPYNVHNHRSQAERQSENKHFYKCNLFASICCKSLKLFGHITTSTGFLNCVLWVWYLEKEVKENQKCDKIVINDRKYTMLVCNQQQLNHNPPSTLLCLYVCNVLFTNNTDAINSSQLEHTGIILEGVLKNKDRRLVWL